MRVVLQRVKEAKVSVEGRVVGAIGTGYLLFLGAEQEDTEETADRMMDKICRLREDQPVAGGRGRGDFGGQPVYPLCGLQKRKPSQLHKGRGAGSGKGSL